MTLDELLAECKASNDYQKLVDQVPYARLFGIQCERFGEEVLFKMPPRQSNIGNPSLPAIHGGALGGFIEHAAILHVIMFMEAPKFPRIIDLSIDYLSAGHYRDTYAECRVLRMGRRIANVSIDLWQKSRTSPIATARAHLLLE